MHIKIMIFLKLSYIEPPHIRLLYNLIHVFLRYLQALCKQFIWRQLQTFLTKEKKWLSIRRIHTNCKKYVN